MATPTYRQGLGRPLTYAEMDGNLEWIEEMLDLSVSWAQGATPPNPSDPESKSSKSWSEVSEGEAERARDWAESENPPDPDDPESKSAKTWAGEAGSHAEDADTAKGIAEGHEQQAQMYAAAAQAAAGIPALAGNGKKVLTVKEDETGVEYQDRVDLDSEQTLKNKTLDEGFSEAVTASEGASIAVGLTPFNKKLLTSNLAVSVQLDEGVSRTLWVNPQTFTVTWPAGTQWVGGFAPELPANKWSLITFTGLPSQMGNADGFGALLWSQP